MIVLGLLYVLAVLDCAFSGYRSAAGKNALIYKGKYFLQRMACGVLIGHIPILIAGSLIFLGWLVTANAQLFLQNVNRAGYLMLVIYVPYTIIVMAAFIVRAIPSVDLRSITSVVIFGPFTILRIPTAIVGVGLAIYHTKDLVVAVITFLVLIMMLSFEKFLRWFFSPKF
ncbi:hypothetical protein [Candidatus Uabimicrobium sp. HlEnr_7]|uniref:hypothetical protein n=1 Tax=Candidatus Uabimicrobium helgolandensis TaxID=3095367 RepID=UPI003558A0DE